MHVHWGGKDIGVIDSLQFKATLLPGTIAINHDQIAIKELRY